MPPDTNRGVYSRLGLASDTLFTALPEAVYVVDMDGQFVQWSDEFSAATGYNQEDLLSLNWHDLLGDDDPKLLARHMQRVHSGEESKYYGSLHTADGEYRRYEFFERPLFDGGDTVVARLGVARPVEQASHTDQFELFVEEVTEYAIFLLTPDGGVLTWNDGARRLKGYREEEIIGQHFSAFYTDEDAAAGVPEQILAQAREHGRAKDQGWRVRKDGSRFWADVTVTAVHNDDGSLRGFTKVTRDLSYYHEQETLVQRQRDELHVLDRLNQLIQTLVQGIVTESTQRAMEQSICDGLAESDLYQSAWVGDIDTDKPMLIVRQSAGDDAVLDALTEAAQDFEFTTQIVQTLHDGKSVAIPNLETDTEIPEPIRTAAAEHNVSACILVPIVLTGSEYGVLVVNATNPNAFSVREQAALEVLGEVMAFAINAIRNRHLLFADAVVELEFQTANRDAFFSGLTHEFDCRCILEGQVLSEDDRTLQYVRVEGLPPEQVYELAVAHDTLDEIRLVSAEGDECLLEVVNTSSGVQALVESGAYVQSGVAENGVATIRTEVAKGEDIRSIVQAFKRVYPDATLASKREYERPARTSHTFRRELEKRLTKRQQTALRTAHLAGYFEWPRGSTAEEVAAAMNISSATLHYHLRRAQYELIDAYLGDGAS